MEASRTITTGRTSRIYIVRSRTGYEVFPGNYMTPSGSSVVFCNRARTVFDVRLPDGVFEPASFTLADGASATVIVRGDSGVYEYEAQESGRPDSFFAQGNSSPRIIVDP